VSTFRGGAEARQNRRYNVRLSAEVTYRGELFTATTRDLSVGGVCLESRRTVPEGDPLRVALFLVVDEIEDPSQPSIDLTGKVAWAAPGEEGRPGTLGVRFEGLTPMQQAGLNRFLKLLPE
jgi:hypothetical protein